MDKVFNVLLVDDHQIVIDGIKSMLYANQYFNVTGFALNGADALSMIQSCETEFDIVITDIFMPGMSGTDLCKAIKQFNSQIKVLVLSMHNHVEYVKAAIDADADGYMLKTIGQSELLHALQAIAEKGAYFSQEIIPLLFKEVKQNQSNHTAVKLTHREQEILDLILKEFTSREIAEKLYISKQTVDTHRLSIMEKTGSKSIVGLIKYALRAGIITVEN
jgi:DNA-binding NarL/FixJ family response regulator